MKGVLAGQELGDREPTGGLRMALGLGLGVGLGKQEWGKVG